MKVYNYHNYRSFSCKDFIEQNTAVNNIITKNCHPAAQQGPEKLQDTRSQYNACIEENRHDKIWFWVLVAMNCAQFIALVSVFCFSFCMFVWKQPAQGAAHTERKNEPDETTALHRMRRTMLRLSMRWVGKRAAPDNEHGWNRMEAPRARLASTNDIPLSEHSSDQSYIEMYSSPLHHY